MFLQHPKGVLFDEESCSELFLVLINALTAFATKVFGIIKWLCWTVWQKNKEPGVRGRGKSGSNYTVYG